MTAAAFDESAFHTPVNDTAMVLAEFLVAVAVGLALSVVLMAIFRSQRPAAKGYWSTLLYLFLLLFLANWAGGVWLGSSGLAIGQWFWVPFVVSGMVAAVALLTLLSLRRPKTTEEAEEAASVQSGMSGLVTVVVWILVAALSISIVAHYAQT